MSDPVVHIKLLMDYLDGKPLYEEVPAIEIGPRRYRIAASPGFAPGVASGDEIELVPSEKLGYRILKRAGNVCVQLFLHSCKPAERVRITDMARAAGGWLDGGLAGPSGHLLIYTFPIAVGFRVIEEAMQRVSEQFDVDKWMYGNVYDTRDGVTPLNWWA